MEWPDAEVQPGQIKVKVMACGICGSDVPRVHGDEAHFYPIVLGHEFSGTVAQVGEGVTNVSVGDRVVVAPLVPCMKCENCQTGNYSQCRHYSFIGSREPGGFAEYVVVPAANIIPIRDNVAFEAGAMFEPCTVALHGIYQADFRPGTDVAVLGAGNIGILAAQWLKILGAKTVTVFDVAPERLELAKRLGADQVVNTMADDFASVKKELIARGGFDYVFETAGQPVTIQLGFELVGAHKHFCCIGTPHRDFQFSWKLWEQLNRKEFHLTASWMSYSAPFPGREWTMTAYYFGTGELKIDESMVAGKYPLQKIDEAFNLFSNGKTVKGKVLVVDPSLAE